MCEKRKAFVVGFPINHSLSPFIHGFWLNFYKIKGSYEAYAIAPDDFSDFVTILKEQEFIGGNVTLPYKEQAFQLAHYRDEAAAAIGAVNSLWFEEGCLWGGNSDAYGFARNLDDFVPSWCERKTALVLGAGGAARAVIFALKQRGFKIIFLANRTKERAKQLNLHFGSVIRVIDWQQINKHIHFADLIINTTSIGLTGNNTGLPLDFSLAKSDAIVSDIVYTPLKTSFLQAAEERGLKTVDGLGMLLHQAVFGFERWFGFKPTVSDELRDYIIEKLEKKG